jgi:hypothetical protein
MNQQADPFSDNLSCRLAKFQDLQLNPDTNLHPASTATSDRLAWRKPLHFPTPLIAVHYNSKPLQLPTISVAVWWTLGIPGPDR